VEVRLGTAPRVAREGDHIAALDPITNVDPDFGDVNEYGRVAIAAHLVFDLDELLIIHVPFESRTEEWGIGGSPAQHPSADLPGVIGPGSGQRHPALVFVHPAEAASFGEAVRVEAVGGCCGGSGETWSGLMAAQVTTFDGAELSINPDWRQDCGVDLKFYTTDGPKSADEVGNVLAHHHMFVELGDATPDEYLTSTPEEVYDALEPWLTEAKARGAGTFVEITPFGVGQRPDIVKYVADMAELPTMMVTGIYREPFVTDDKPGWVYGASVEELADFMRGELSDDPGVGGTGVPAGIIKLSQNDTGMTLTESKILEAACMVAQETDATIASHITAGPTALAVMDALEGFGCDLDRYRFVWIHTQVTAKADGAALEGTWGSGHVPGFDYLLAAAERGAYISLDGIGSGFWTDFYGGFDLNLGWIMDLVAAGYEDQIVIGADTGWYDPGYPGEEVSWPGSQDYNSVFEFADFMADEGVSPELIQKLMHDNPFAAYAR
jgi:predicted metal-dependent phosphotriesterase family hydrolase